MCPFWTLCSHVWFVNRMYPGKSLKTSFESPGKPWNSGFFKSWKVLENSILLSVRTLFLSNVTAINYGNRFLCVRSYIETNHDIFRHILNQVSCEILHKILHVLSRVCLQMYRKSHVAHNLNHFNLTEGLFEVLTVSALNSAR